MEPNNPSVEGAATSHRGNGVAEHVLANAPYGKACLNCVRSKTRCAILPSGPKCERCLRLNKDCNPAPTIRKRKVTKKSKSATASVASKTAALEERLEGLTQIIQRSQEAQAAASSLSSRSVSSESSSRLETGSSSQSSDLALATNGSGDSTDASQRTKEHQNVIEFGNFFNYGKLNNKPRGSSALTQNDALAHRTYAPPTPSASSSSASIRLPCPVAFLQENDPAGGYPNQKVDATPASFPTYTDFAEETELEEALETYRTKMTPFFPIAVINMNVTARGLIEEKPFLSLVLRAVCSKSSARQAELGVEVRRVLGREMLLEGSKTMDLLLGLLVFSAWGHFYIYHKPIISTIIHLATSIALDLGLTKPVPTEMSLVMLTYNVQGCPKPLSAVVRTMEERRSIIGLFLISSVCSCYFQRIEPLRWVPYLEECLQLLEKTREYPTDQFLVFLVRLQRIKNTVSRDMAESAGGGPANPLSELYIKSLQSQLDELKRNIPPELESHVIVQLHLHHTVLTLHEHCLGSVSTKHTAPDPSQTHQLVKNLWTCLNATKSWFTIFVSSENFPLSTYADMPMALMAQMAHCIVALYRLTTFECPGVSWDRQLVRQEIDLGEMINLLSEKWGSVPEAAGLDVSGTGAGVNNIWILTKRMFLKVGNWWELKVVGPANAAAAASVDTENQSGEDIATSHDNVGDSGGGLQGFGAQGQVPMQDIDFGAPNMDLLDEVWMRDLLAGDFQYQLDPFM